MRWTASKRDEHNKLAKGTHVLPNISNIKSCII
jgi:hypothetical protein